MPISHVLKNIMNKLPLKGCPVPFCEKNELTYEQLNKHL
jgi:hypothetical protein